MRVICSLALLVTLAGCAHGPIVTHVDSPNTKWRNQDHQVFYALPRTLLQVEVPTKTQTLQCGLLHWLGSGETPNNLIDFPGDCPTQIPDPKTLDSTQREIGMLQLNDRGILTAHSQCNIKSKIEPVNECALSFRRSSLKKDLQLLACDTHPPANVVLAGDPTVTLVTVPDPDHVYAISLKPGPFEKLKLDMELAANGIPTKLSSVSSSALVDTIQTVIGSSVGGFMKASGGIHAELFDFGISNGDEDIKAAIGTIIKQIIALERERQAKLREANGQAAAAALAAEQAQLRTLIEGGTKDSEERLRITFDPPNPKSVKVDNDTLFQTTVPEGVLGFHPCGKPADPTAISVAAVLHLAPDGYSHAWVERQSPTITTGNSQGFRYRVPRQVATAIELRSSCATGCNMSRPASEITTDPVVWKPGQYEIARSLSINQWGVVRSLPRRVGWGAGSVSASLDPQTGALKLVGTEGAGSMQQPFIAAMAEAGKDHELSALQREKTELELRLSICNNRRNLGLPVPADCPAVD